MGELRPTALTVATGTTPSQLDPIADHHPNLVAYCS